MVNFFRKLSTRLLIVVSFAALSTVFVANAQKDDSTTTGDSGEDSSILTLPILLDGEPLEFTFEGTDGALLAAFNASAGDQVDIAMTALSSGLDPFIVIFGASGELVAQDDDSGEEALDSLVSGFEVPVDGTYFILATTFGNRNVASAEDGADQEFTLSVDGNTQPADIEVDSFSYTAITLEGSDSGTLDITEDNPAYFIIFQGEEGVDIVIDAPSASGSSLDTLMMLFDANGLRVAVDDDGGEEPLASHIETTLPSTGIYFLIVTTYDYASVAAGDTEVGEGVIDFSIEIG